MRATRKIYTWSATAALALLVAGPSAAKEPLVPALPPGPSCQADAPPVDSAVLDRLAQELQQLPSAETPDGQPIVVLNNSGYNYGEPQGQGLDLLQLQRELLQIHLEAQQ